MTKKNGNAKPAGVVHETPVAKFNSFVKRVETAHGEMAEARMDHAEIWKEAKDLHIHSKALKDALKLKRMESSESADYLRAFDTYLDALGVRAQADLLDQQRENEAKAESISRASEAAPTEPTIQ